MLISFRLRADVLMDGRLECPEGIDSEHMERYIRNHLDLAEIDWNSEAVDFGSMELIDGSAIVEN